MSFSHKARAFLASWQGMVFIALILFSLGTRIYNLAYPTAYYFDEVYHAMTAKLIARNDPRGYEWTHADTIEPNTYVEWLHPPLAKYAQAAGILAFGENGIGWRASSVVFGLVVVLLTVGLSQLLFGRMTISLLAGWLAALDGLLLAQSRIAMNDIHVVALYLLSLIVYAWYRKKPAYWRLLMVGLTLGMTVATKWSGLYCLVAIVLFETGALIWSTLRRWQTSAQLLLPMLDLILAGFIRLLALLALPLLVYVASYAQMFAQGKNLPYFVELHQQIFYYQFHLDATHPFQSVPWQWVLDLRPVWYFVEYFPDQSRADIFNLGNVVLFWGGAVAAMGTLVFILMEIPSWLKKIRGQSVSRPQLAKLSAPLLATLKWQSNQIAGLSLILLTYGFIWIPWSISPRIMFFYHYAPAVPMLCLLLSYWLHRMWTISSKKERWFKQWNKIAVIAYLTLVVAFFVLWYPQWTAIRMPAAWKEALYYPLPSWR